MDPAATNALEHLHLEEDGLSDEYDFMEDVEDGKAARQKPGQYPDPKRKYMDMMQQVADRKLSEVTIDLDDLENVSVHWKDVLISPPEKLTSGSKYEKGFTEETKLRLVDCVERNTKHYVDIFSEAVDKVMPKETNEIT